MKHYLTISLAILLSACGGITQEEFFQDKQNMDKSIELANKAIESGCDKLTILNNFIQIETPNGDDLAKIMPALGLKAIDSKDIDKMYTLDLSMVKKYKCSNIRDEKINYCRQKYSNVFKENQCLASVYDKIPPFSTYGIYDNTTNYIYDGEDVYKILESKIRKIHPLPDDTEKFLPVFSASELIKTRKEILGKYDGDCSSGGWLCEEDKTVTRLNAIRILYSVCKHSFRYLGEQPECVCYAHETYKKVNYQNLIYIDEKGGKLPQSKKTEFDQIFKKCKQKLEKQRYGETSDY